MLKQRIITALILLAILLPALFAQSPAPFVALSLVLIAAAAWEWSRLIGWRGITALATGALCAVICGALWWGGALEQPVPLLWLAATAMGVPGGAWLIQRGVPGWSKLGRGLRWFGGIAVLCTAWLALAQARIIGVNFLLSILTLVWAADVFAYFFGRGMGGKITRYKLAPSISPGKSWEGVWGGMLGVLLVALVWVWIDRAYSIEVPSLYTRLLERGGWFLLAGCLFLSAMSVVGDLVESLVKRSAGAKDSSGLLPGHGGVLDRIDALLPVLPLAMMLVSVGKGLA
ncbi:phosphatidate cytidylyltransferase [Ottowia thiooxydans]|uniref:phosphatidate cytidylyltransferase n=1 Tax=Ottowia thiooxydans TaxID=219182 RepID=UPI00040C5BFE|nr:phosphatidate cytidylyltransferase [Ottowia thiooxydans]